MNARLKKRLKEKFAGKVDEIVQKAIEEAGEEDGGEESSSLTHEDVKKMVSEGVAASFESYPFFKALGGAAEEPDEDAQLKKELRRYIRKHVSDAIEISSEVVVKAVRESILEMFGGEDGIKKINLIGKKLKVVKGKQSASPDEDGDDEEDAEEPTKKSKPSSKEAIRKKKGGRGRFDKKGTVEDLDETIGDIARQALKG